MGVPRKQSTLLVLRQQSAAHECGGGAPPKSCVVKKQSTLHEGSLARAIRRECERPALIRPAASEAEGALRCVESPEEAKQLFQARCGREVLDDEVDYFLRCFGSPDNGTVAIEEVDSMIQSFLRYDAEKKEADRVLAKYAGRQAACLSRSDLRGLMADLAGGAEVSEEQVDSVLAEVDLLGSGQIARPEVLRAVSICSSKLEQRRNGACCVLQ